MHSEVRRLAADSGELLAVTGSAVAGRRFIALFLRFERGTLKLSCNDDTDEIVASVSDDPEGHDDVSHDALNELVGLTLDYAWELRNHRDFMDGFQVRLRDGHGREETLQFEVGASAMDVRRVVG
jgi:hypothetical protein